MLMVAGFGTAAAQQTAGNTKQIDAFSLSYTSEGKGEYKTALSIMESIQSPTDYAVNLRLGWLSYLAGDLNASAKYYLTAIKLEPKSVEGRLGYAYPVAALKQWDKLAEIYEEILKVSMNNNTALYRLGLLNYNLGNFAKAQVYLDKLVDLYPFDYYANLLKGWNELKLGKYKESEATLSKVLTIKPGDTSAVDGLKLLRKQ
jgi:tetratricopeptide (TPR) repeat protein